MAKKLKLAFAMGGGVSLGTFSGAALTECIKQLIVFGVYKDKEKRGQLTRYDQIEIDVMSGASAGAMALGIMIRAFTYHKDIIKLLAGKGSVYPEATKDNIDEFITKHLKAQFGEHYDALSDTNKKALFATQVAQDFERYLWCYQVDIMALTGNSEKKWEANLTGKNSLLDRGFLEEMAKGTIIPKAGINITGNDRQVLADRVLYACTLTRIEPFILDSPFEGRPFESNAVNDRYKELYKTVLKDAVTSYSHRDIRVFDINYKDLDATIQSDSDIEYPKRWLTIMEGPKQDYDGRKVFALSNQDAWAHITATAIAAGTFPVAFEPTTLTRYKEELTAPNANPHKQDEKFSYIDGGTFNNEPIAEAFRLASFLDASAEGVVGEDFDRFVLYVDPFVNTKTPVKIKGYNQAYHLVDHEIKETPTISRLASFIPSLISILRGEGSISELDKSIAIFNRFKNRASIKSFYSKTIDIGLPKTFEGFKKLLHDSGSSLNLSQEIEKIVKELKQELNAQYSRQVIPSVSLSLESEIRRIIIDPENSAFFSEMDNGLGRGAEVIDFLKSNNLSDNKNIDHPIVKDYNKFFNHFKYEDVPYFHVWLKSLFFAYIELVMDLSGKNQKAILIPIGPLKFVENQFSSIKLEGEKIEGFYGFFDLNIRMRDFDKGIYASKNVLRALELIKDDGEEITLREPTDQEMLASEEEVKKNFTAVMKKRVFNEILKENLNDALDKSNNWMVSAYVKFGRFFFNTFEKNDAIESMADSLIKGEEKHNITIKIAIPEGNYQIDNVDRGSEADISAIQPKHLLFVHPTVSKDSKNGFYWDVEKEKQEFVFSNGPESVRYLRIVFDNNFHDEDLLLLPLPSPLEVKKAVDEYTNPVFEADLSRVKDQEFLTNLKDRVYKYFLEHTVDNSVWTLVNDIEPLEELLVTKSLA
jgi:hypothetical protein